MAKLKDPVITKDEVTPFQLAQIAAQICKSGADPRLSLPQAQNLLVTARRFLNEGVASIVEYAKNAAELRNLIPAPSSAFGWNDFLPKLRRPGGKSTGPNRSGVCRFLEKLFQKRN